MVFFPTLLGAAAIYARIASAAPMPYGGSSSSSYGSSSDDTSSSNYGSSSYGSSSSDMSSGYGSSSSGYDSSSGYGSSPSDMSSGYGSSDSGSGYGMNSWSSPSAMMDDSTSTMMYDSTSTSSTYMTTSSTMMDDATSTYQAMNTYQTSTYQATSTYMATSTAAATSTSPAYSMPTYGSGSSSWESSGYDNCVQQCVASYSAPMAMYTPTATNSYSTATSGATHTIIVAPSQGVLRYVPYAVNASVGDTIKFMWGANEHTVTKSSVLTPCNETKDAPFASGEQNKSFVFTQVVNDTNTTWFYCGTPTHCEKGMFGLINPPNAAGGDGAASSMMASAVTNSSSMAAMASYTSMMTANNSVAANWGSQFDLSSVPEWAQSLAMENIMYTRTFLAANPDVISADGSINLGNAGSNPLMIPMDLAQAVSNDAASSSSSASASAASSSASATGSASSAAASSTQSTTGAAKSGAGQLASPRAAVGLVGLAAMLFML